MKGNWLFYKKEMHSSDNSPPPQSPHFTKKTKHPDWGVFGFSMAERGRFFLSNVVSLRESRSQELLATESRIQPAFFPTRTSSVSLRLRIPSCYVVEIRKYPPFRTDIFVSHGGEREIRTPGGLPHTRFPSVRTRPLCDLSISYILTFRESPRDSNKSVDYLTRDFPSRARRRNGSDLSKTTL